jgi:alpha-L-rhamnosidase
VRASHETVRGRIASAWRKTGDGFTLNVTIPANASALVFVPATEASRVTEGGSPAAEAPGVKFVRMENGVAVFAVGSGRYEFATR